MPALFSVALLASSFAGVPAVAQTDAQWDWCCDGKTDPDLQIGACTAWIQSGRPNTAQVKTWFVNRGVAYYRKGQLHPSIADRTQAIGVDPSQYDGLPGRCWPGFMLSQTQSAERNCEEALRLKPNDTGASIDLGIVRLRLRRWNDAIADFDADLLIFPTGAYARYGRAIANFGLGNRGKAQVDLTLAKHEMPRNDEIFQSYNLNATLP